jgi:hypothetical protein
MGFLTNLFSSERGRKYLERLITPTLEQLARYENKDEVARNALFWC